MLRNNRLVFLGVFSACLAAALWACGADQLVAPRTRQAAQESCGSTAELMPIFLRATRTGQTEGLRYVLENHLSVSEDGDPIPPLGHVLVAIFRTTAKFAAQPPEPGAALGEKCAVVAPPVEEANPLCEMRRSLDSLVHQGAGIEALKLADPLIAAVLNYIIGREPSSATPHYAELSPVVSGLFEQSAVCNVKDTLDLVIGISAFAGTPEGRVGLERIEALVNHPELQPYILDDGNEYGGEEGIVALGHVLVRTIQSMDDPADLNSLPVSVFPHDVQPMLELALGDMKILLDPKRSPNVLKPMQKVLTCVNLKDTHSELVRMVYRLGLEKNLESFGIHNLVGVIRGLRDADQRGSLLRLTQIFAKAIRDDSQASSALALMGRTLFSTVKHEGQLKTNAELALPVMADLFAQGVIAEGVCAADTLLYGCAGGDRPACKSE